jgi:iron complex outermembrane receptor protein
MVVGSGGFGKSAILGNSSFQNENLIAYEACCRANICNRFPVDVAAYYTDNQNQKIAEHIAPFFEAMPSPPRLVIPFTFEDLSRGETDGIEIAGNWKVMNRWTLRSEYAFEKIHFHAEAGSYDTVTVPGEEGNISTHSAQLWSHADFPRGLGWDTSAYLVDRLDSQGVPTHTWLDIQFMSRCTKEIPVSLVGQNLLQVHHPEWSIRNQGHLPNLIKRSAGANITWRFDGGR